MDALKTAAVAALFSLAIAGGCGSGGSSIDPTKAAGGATDPKVVVEESMKGLEDKSVFRRRLAAAALGKQGKAAEPALDKLRAVAAKDPDPETKKAAADAIAEIEAASN